MSYYKAPHKNPKQNNHHDVLLGINQSVEISRFSRLKVFDGNGAIISNMIGKKFNPSCRENQCNNSDKCQKSSWIKTHVESKTKTKTKKKQKTKPTKLWKDDKVLGVALWTQDFSGAVSSLFFIDPALQAHLMYPAVCTAAPARSYPQCIAVVFLRRKANPTCPAPTHEHADIHHYLCYSLHATSHNQRQKMYPLKYFCHFLAIIRNFEVKFYTFITSIM